MSSYGWTRPSNSPCTSTLTKATLLTLRLARRVTSTESRARDTRPVNDEYFNAPASSRRVLNQTSCSVNTSVSTRHENPDDYCYFDWTPHGLAGDGETIVSHARHTHRETNRHAQTGRVLVESATLSQRTGSRARQYSAADH